MNINSDFTIERVGNQWLVLADRDGVVHNLTGQAADVIDCVTTGQPIPPECDDAVATLVDTGILTADTGWSRRKVLAAGGAAAAIGMVTLTLPTAAMAASNPGPAGINATAGFNQATVTWTAVEGTTYQVYYKLSTADDTNYTTFGGPVAAGPVTVTNLQPGVAYSFYLVSIVGGVESAPSSVATATTLTADPNLGSTWTAVTAPEQNSWQSVAYGNPGNTANGVWVAISGGGTNRVMRSADGGLTWTPVEAAAANQWTSVGYGNGVWVAVNATNDVNTTRVMRSIDGGVSWTPVAAGGVNGWQSVAYGNGVWVAVANSNAVDTTRVMRSTDGGLTWTAVPASGVSAWVSVAYGDGVWVAVANSNTTGATQVMRSTDGGVTWIAVAAAEASGWRSVAYANGVWVAVAFSGTNRVMRSTNGGVTWTAVAAAAANPWYSLAYGDGVWVAVAYSGTNRVMRSTDGGLTWTGEAAAVETDGWSAVAYGNGRFVAVAFSGTSRVMYSPSPTP